MAGGRAYSNAYFGRGHGPIFLDDVQCSSSSNYLLECPSKTAVSHNCLHTEDAGVGCEGMFCIGTESYCFHLASPSPQLHVQMVSCGWQEVMWQMKVEWRSA